MTIRPWAGGGGGGSVLGALLLFAGMAIGAGAVALPAETADTGFVPSALGFLLCWAYTCITLLVTLEASWLSSSSASAALSMRGDDKGGGNGGGAGFLFILRMVMGPPGEGITASLLWFLLTAIIVALRPRGAC
jgi:hypothetical protein